jgi:hypothetical protein
MITQAPLPTWLNLCRAMVRQSPPDVKLAAPWCREGDVGGWVSRSAWSLALVALWRQRSTAGRQPIVWIPDYFCNSSLVALRATGAKLVFYPLTTRMSPDMDECRRHADAGPPDVFLLVHYFGQPAVSPHLREFCTTHGAWLIEDAAHVLRPVEGVGQLGDFVIYSPHKHLAIPDGALLVVRSHGVSKLDGLTLESMGLPARWSDQLDGLQKAMGLALTRGRARVLIWLFRRMMQKMGVRNWRRAPVPYAESTDSNAAVSEVLIGPGQSRLSKRLLGGLIADLGPVARQRQRHELLWDVLVSDDASRHKGALSPAERSMGRAWTPYLCGYQVDASAAPAVYEDWQRRGLPVTTWPDLPPEVIDSRDSHANALKLRHTRLYLPVHQSLSVAKMVKQWAPKMSYAEPQLHVSWGEASASQWQEWVAQAAHSNLLQSWAYGQAKSDVSGWHCKRVVFYLDQDPVALVQVLQKRVLGAILVSRINRGPLFLEVPDENIKCCVWEELGRLGCLWRGKILSVAPELSLSGANLVMMESLGFRQFSPRASESAWIDLNLELPILRQKLDGKWRNALKSAEATGLRLDAGTGDWLVEWMMERYKELMSEKSFSGSPVDLLLALRKQLPSEQGLVVLRAMDGEEAVAGICLVQHGVAATYLLGWNGVKGRKLKANQYLLWQAIVYLKQAGVKYFDLGGIDEDGTPGIAAFKLGMGGDRYELLGEYWKW